MVCVAGTDGSMYPEHGARTVSRAKSGREPDHCPQQLDPCFSVTQVNTSNFCNWFESNLYHLPQTVSGPFISLCILASGPNHLSHLFTASYWPWSLMAALTLLMLTLASPQGYNLYSSLGPYLILAALGNNQHNPSLAGCYRCVAQGTTGRQREFTASFRKLFSCLP